MKKRKAVFIVCGVLAAFVLVYLLSLPRLKMHAESVGCANQMISICYAARQWAMDNNEFMPTNFLSMSNDLVTPRILICPGDHSRQVATNWFSFTQDNCSYVILGESMRGGDSGIVFVRCPIHGYVGCADGSVFKGTRKLSKSF